MNLRTIREWEKLPYGEGDDQIPQATAKRLLAAAEGLFPNKLLRGYIDALQAQSIVGVLTVPGWQLEILPKIERPANGEAPASDDEQGALDDGEAGRLRHRLVRLLGVVLDLDIKDGEMAQLEVQKHTLLEVLIRLFIQKLRVAVRRGLPQHYIARADDLPALRGRLDVIRQFSHLAASPQKLACRYDERSCDIPPNQIMKASITALLGWAQSLENQRSLRELALLYADVSSIPLKALRWDDISWDRTMRHWQVPFRLAKLLLKKQFQTTSTGQNGGVSLLFDMSVLFEKYIAKRARTALARQSSAVWEGVDVVPQGGRKYALHSKGSKFFQTKPDILFRVKGKNDALCIIDTKWKLLKDEDGKLGVSQSDVYQMMAYAQIYNCKNLILLYPAHYDMEEEGIFKSYDMVEPGSDCRLTVATIDISSDKDDAREKIEKKILRLLKGNLDLPVADTPSVRLS